MHDIPYVPKKMTTGLSGLITFENEYENKCGLACQTYNYSPISGENFRRFASVVTKKLSFL